MVQENASTLLPSYSGDQERQIKDRRDEVLQAWQDLRFSAEQRRALLMDANDFHRFVSMVRELRLWMTDIRAEMEPAAGEQIGTLVGNYMKIFKNKKNRNIYFIVKKGHIYLRITTFWII